MHQIVEHRTYLEKIEKNETFLAFCVSNCDILKKNINFKENGKMASEKKLFKFNIF